MILFHVSPTGLRDEIRADGLDGSEQLQETIECGQPAGIYGFSDAYQAVSWALNGDATLWEGADLWIFEAEESLLEPDRMLSHSGSWYLPATHGALPAQLVGAVPARDELGLGPWVEGEEWNDQAEQVLVELEAVAAQLCESLRS